MANIRERRADQKHDASAVLIASCYTTVGRQAVASAVAFEDAAALLRYPTGFVVVVSGPDGTQYIAREREFIEVVAFVCELSGSVELWLRGLDDGEEHAIRLIVDTLNDGAARQRKAA